jgi:hypothetical protein
MSMRSWRGFRGTVRMGRRETRFLELPLFKWCEGRNA